MAAAQQVGTPVDAASFTLPHVPGTDRVPQRIAAEDEAELRWFLDSPPVACLAQSGGFGAQLERAESFGYGALPCRKCGGAWKMRRRKRDGTEVVIGWRDGTGRRPRKHFGKQETYAAALARYRRAMVREHRIVVVTHHPADPAVKAAVRAAFDARDQHPLTEAELRELFPALPDDWTTECNACGGIGVVPRRAPTHTEVTVWFTGSSKQEGRTPKAVQEVADAADRAYADGFTAVSRAELERYLEVERLLRDVAALSLVARVALEEYYAPRTVQTVGLARGAKFTPRPTAFEALWPLTSVGLIAASAGAKARRMRESQELYSHACSVYNLAAYGAGS